MAVVAIIYVQKYWKFYTMPKLPRSTFQASEVLEKDYFFPFQNERKLTYTVVLWKFKVNNSNASKYLVGLSY